MDHVSNIEKIYFRLKKNNAKKNPTYRAQFFHEEKKELYKRIRNGKEYKEYRAKVLLTRYNNFLTFATNRCNYIEGENMALYNMLV